MSAQSSYARYFSGLFAGLASDSGTNYKRSLVNGSGGALGTGIAVKAKTDGISCDVLSAAGDKLAGIVLNDFARDPDNLTGSGDAIKSTASAPMLCEGAVTVNVDQTVAVGDPVFVRYAASGNAQAGAIGSFRKDADATIQVATGTPTAANSTVYVVRVETVDVTGKRQSWTFEYKSDADGTATEITTGFKTAMAADAAFSALITASGTATLVLTAGSANTSFTATSEGDGAVAFAATTPNAPSARLCRGARWLTGAASGGVAELYFSAAIDNAF